MRHAEIGVDHALVALHFIGRAVVALADHASVRFAGVVVRPVRPRVVAVLAGAGGLAVGGALGAAVSWVLGVVVMLAGLIAAGVVLARTEGR